MFGQANVRAAIERVIRERKVIAIGNVPWRRLGPKMPVAVDVAIAPVDDRGGALMAVVDVSRRHDLLHELDQSRDQLGTAYQELQSLIEELEAANAELQAANEELETTNEELQSTNEELETMVEELQAGYQELETLNEELRERGSDFTELNQFLHAILGSLDCGVVVLDPAGRVRVWSRGARELWGRRAEEVVGRDFYSLDTGLPAECLQDAIGACLAGRSERDRVRVTAVSRRGVPVDCTVTVAALSSETARRGGVILLMDTAAADASAGPADGAAGRAAVRARDAAAVPRQPAVDGVAGSSPR